MRLNKAAKLLGMSCFLVKEARNKSFDKLPSTKLRTNGNFLIPFVVSLSNHVRSTLNQSFLNRKSDILTMTNTPLSPRLARGRSAEC
jgi:hypothetical protein